jgi:hypothetical protein
VSCPGERHLFLDMDGGKIDCFPVVETYAKPNVTKLQNRADHGASGPYETIFWVEEKAWCCTISSLNDERARRGVRETMLQRHDEGGPCQFRSATTPSSWYFKSNSFGSSGRPRSLQDCAHIVRKGAIESSADFRWRSSDSEHRSWSPRDCSFL